jgi:hypothetical protein
VDLFVFSGSHVSVSDEKELSKAIDKAKAGVTRFKNNISNYGTYNKPEQVLYGNIVFQGRHNIYTQHDYSKNGFEYFANNIFVNPQQKPGAADAFTFHAYGSKDIHLSGYYLKSNIFNGRMLIGGAGYPVSNIIAENNEYYASTPQFGYAENGISQYKFRNNFVSRSTLEVQHTWGADDPNFTQEANTEITEISLFIRQMENTSNSKPLIPMAVWVVRN